MLLALLTLASAAIAALLFLDRPWPVLLAAGLLLALVALDARRDVRVGRDHPSRLVAGCR